jgi:phage shock protein A
MSVIKRLTTTLFSQIDHAVGEIENHDALIEAAIAEQRKKLAAAKVQLARIQEQERRVQKQMEQLKADAARWEQRAVQAATDDEARALACLQRRKQATEQAERLAATRHEYQTTATRMAADIGSAEEELSSLSQKHALLRARQTSSEALATPHKAGVANLAEIEKSFDRWEVRIAQNGALLDHMEPVDELEESYRTQEEDEALRDELRTLMQKESKDEHQ